MNIVSINPEYVAEIKAGHKRIEFCKVLFVGIVEKVYIYASYPVSKVVREFQPVDVIIGNPAAIWKQTGKYAGPTKAFYDECFSG